MTYLKLIDGQWQTPLFLNPGKYQYQIVIDGKWQLDYDNPISEPNGNGGVNSVINIINQIDKKPKLEFSFTNGKLKINNRNAEKVFVFWKKSAYIFKRNYSSKRSIQRSIFLSKSL